jgi:hypothetical protein
MSCDNSVTSCVGVDVWLQRKKANFSRRQNVLLTVRSQLSVLTVSVK